MGCLNKIKRYIKKRYRIKRHIIKFQKTIICKVHEFQDLSTLITVIMSALIAVEINILTSERELAFYIHLCLIVAIISLAGWFYFHIWITRRYDKAKEKIKLCIEDEKKSARNPRSLINNPENNRILKSALKGDHMSKGICCYLTLMLLSIIATTMGIEAIAVSRKTSMKKSNRIENCCKCLCCPHTHKISPDCDYSRRNSALPSFCDSISVVETIQTYKPAIDVDVAPMEVGDTLILP